MKDTYRLILEACLPEGVKIVEVIPNFEQEKYYKGRVTFRLSDKVAVRFYPDLKIIIDYWDRADAPLQRDLNDPEILTMIRKCIVSLHNARWWLLRGRLEEKYGEDSSSLNRGGLPARGNVD